MLRHVAAACGAGALVWVVGVAMTAAAWGHRLPSFATWREAALFVLNAGPFLGLLLLIWTLAALGAAVGVARAWFVPTAGFGGGILLIGLLKVAGHTPPLAAAIATALLVIVSMGGTAAAFLTARQRRLASMSTMLGVLAVYVILVLACWLVVRSEGDPSLKAILCGLGLCAAPLAPLAAARLTLAWNRRR